MMNHRSRKGSPTVEVRVGSFADMRADVNRILDNPDIGEAQPTKVVYLSPEDVPKFLSGQRIRLIHKMRTGDLNVGELAAALKRKRENVSRDITLLSRLGLVELKKVGRQAKPIARRSITVTI